MGEVGVKGEEIAVDSGGSELFSGGGCCSGCCNKGMQGGAT